MTTNLYSDITVFRSMVTTIAQRGFLEWANNTRIITYTSSGIYDKVICNVCKPPRHSYFKDTSRQTVIYLIGHFDKFHPEFLTAYSLANI